MSTGQRQTITVTLPPGFHPGDVLIIKVSETDRGALYRVKRKQDEFHFEVRYLRWYERAWLHVRAFFGKLFR